MDASFIDYSLLAIFALIFLYLLFSLIFAEDF